MRIITIVSKRLSSRSSRWACSSTVRRTRRTSRTSSTASTCSSWRPRSSACCRTRAPTCARRGWRARRRWYPEKKKDCTPASVGMCHGPLESSRRGGSFLSTGEGRCKADMAQICSSRRPRYVGVLLHSSADDVAPHGWPIQRRWPYCTGGRIARQVKTMKISRVTRMVRALRPSADFFSSTSRACRRPTPGDMCQSKDASATRGFFRFGPGLRLSPVGTRRKFVASVSALRPVMKLVRSVRAVRLVGRLETLKLTVATMIQAMQYGHMCNTADCCAI